MLHLSLPSKVLQNFIFFSPQLVIATVSLRWAHVNQTPDVVTANLNILEIDVTVAPLDTTISQSADVSREYFSFFNTQYSLR